MSDPYDAHLTDDVWERLAMAELAPDERAAALRHVTSCRECAAIYKGVLALEAGARRAGLDGPPAIAPVEGAAGAAVPLATRRARPRWRWAAAGAAVAAAAALLLWWQTRPARVTDEPRVTRGPGQATIAMRAPAGQPLAFDWSPVAGARAYRVSVFTADGVLAWSREVAAPPVSWPPAVAAAAGDYRWKVEALGPAGVLAGSSLGSFRIEP
jgi:hypothetical protein